jgi:lysozyme family protein
MSSFLIAYDLTMSAEGGYVNDPLDAGGETYKGVSRVNHPHWEGWVTIDAIKTTKPPVLNTALNHQLPLQEKVRHFYETEFWNVNRTGEIASQQLANQLFDTAVNSGGTTAAKLLQRAAGVTEDGMIGPRTLKAVNAAAPRELYNKFIAIRKKRYEDIVEQKPSQQRFMAGWLSRLTPYHDVA